MAIIKGHALIIGSPEEAIPRECEYCGKIDELRPYGRGGAYICYECGMKPENRATTDMMLGALLNSAPRINPDKN